MCVPPTPGPRQTGRKRQEGDVPLAAHRVALPPAAADRLRALRRRLLHLRREELQRRRRRRERRGGRPEGRAGLSGPHQEPLEGRSGWLRTLTVTVMF